MRFEARFSEEFRTLYVRRHRRPRHGDLRFPLYPRTITADGDRNRHPVKSCIPLAMIMSVSGIVIRSRDAATGSAVGIASLESAICEYASFVSPVAEPVTDRHPWKLDLPGEGVYPEPRSMHE